ncbi:hypothetical protein WJX72_007611 [[Myrmecia] bisecta]|uniref:Uncharacterized protein n=1 Tax=[Myrmecia] bisecta TaxID=41462 RepID=A0AAW1QG17_9CHLO
MFPETYCSGPLLCSEAIDLDGELNRAEYPLEPDEAWAAACSSTLVLYRLIQPRLTRALSRVGLLEGDLRCLRTHVGGDDGCNCSRLMETITQHLRSSRDIIAFAVWHEQFWTFTDLGGMAKIMMAPFGDIYQG